MSERLPILLTVALLLTVLPCGSVSAQPSGSEEAFDACYVEDVGALYLIAREGLPAECLSSEHVQVSWTEGGGVSAHGELTGLSADDHEQYLLTDGVREATDGFAVTGQLGTGAIPVEGGGARLMWYPHEAAFRVGAVGLGFETAWDAGNVGLGSMAFGTDTEASGRYSTAIGRETTASGETATAIGNLTLASGRFATAMGSATTASENNATAMGLATTASGASSTAMNSATTASGNFATAVGSYSTAQSYASLALGRYNLVEGDAASWVWTDPLLVAGNGVAGSPSNALTLLKNGDLTIAGTLTQSSDARLKTDIRPLESTLEDLRSIQPVRFRFREGTGHPTDAQIGVLAQEVQEVFPELVSTDGQGHLSVAYPMLSAVVLEGLREQQTLIEEQQTRIAAQADELESLRAAVARLEAAFRRLEEVEADAPR